MKGPGIGGGVACSAIEALSPLSFAASCANWLPAPQTWLEFGAVALPSLLLLALLSPVGGSFPASHSQPPLVCCACAHVQVQVQAEDRIGGRQIALDPLVVVVVVAWWAGPACLPLARGDRSMDTPSCLFLVRVQSAGAPCWWALLLLLLQVSDTEPHLIPRSSEKVTLIFSPPSSSY